MPAIPRCVSASRSRRFRAGHKDRRTDRRRLVRRSLRLQALAWMAAQPCRHPAAAARRDRRIRGLQIRQSRDRRVLDHPRERYPRRRLWGDGTPRADHIEGHDVKTITVDRRGRSEDEHCIVTIRLRSGRTLSQPTNSGRGSRPARWGPKSSGGSGSRRRITRFRSALLATLIHDRELVLRPSSALAAAVAAGEDGWGLPARALSLILRRREPSSRRTSPRKTAAGFGSAATRAEAAGHLAFRAIPRSWHCRGSSKNQSILVTYQPGAP